VHGHATAVEVRMARDGEDLVMTVIDDGIGPQRGDRGLGAEVLDDATTRRWALRPGDRGGSAVTATICAYEELSPCHEA
ncbi:MAG: hypothetical protein ACR2J9_09745, partial [Gaiellales bacterium]